MAENAQVSTLSSRELMYVFRVGNGEDRRIARAELLRRLDAVEALGLKVVKDG